MFYIVATPIGNLDEITFRAVKVLNEVDFIAAEDTRHTALLLNKYGIKKQTICYQKFNEKASAEGIISLLKEGKSGALVSDAGMPLISDPGGTLIKRLREENLDYTVVSGACALINALVLSGLDSSAFCMCGFLPVKMGERKKHLDKFRDLSCTLIFYSPCHAISSDLQFLGEELKGRKVSVVREISKLHEEVICGILGENLDFTHKGEFVIVVEGALRKEYNLSVTEHYESYIRQGLSRMDAMKKVAADRGVSKSVIYAELSGGD